VERVDLERVRHADRQRWRSGGEWNEHAPKIAVGQLADGRWYARIYAGNTYLCARPVSWPGERKGCAYAGEHAEWFARRTARCWMRTLGGKWIEAG
jgi:hypothetical protein